MKKSTIAILGAGVVGSTTAYTLMLRNIASKIILVDIDDIKCRGEVDDLSDALSLSTTSEICLGTLHDAAQADIAIMSAGIAQKPGQSRSELLTTNYEIIKNLMQNMQPLNPELIIIMVTNPVDILTYACQNFSGLPKKQIFGSGTLLDSNRLRELISSKVGISPQSIHVYSLGEHGDNQFVAWSSAYIDGMPLSDFPELNSIELEKMAQLACNKAYSIIECKGSTAFGIAASIATYCQNILFDAKRIIPVSCYIEEYDVCMSMPAVLGISGVEQILHPELTEQEEEQMKKSIDSIKNLLKIINF